MPNTYGYGRKFRKELESILKVALLLLEIFKFIMDFFRNTLR